jgi:hypothetical protein
MLVDIMGIIKRGILGTRLHNNVEIFLEGKRDSSGNDAHAERAAEARRKLVDEIVPSIKQEMGKERADRAFSLVIKTVKARAEGRGFNRADIREVEGLLR